MGRPKPTTGGETVRLDNGFARIITRCKVLHFSPKQQVVTFPGRIFLPRRNNFSIAGWRFFYVG
jgi:hypothetical protein